MTDSLRNAFVRDGLPANGGGTPEPPLDPPIQPLCGGDFPPYRCTLDDVDGDVSITFEGTEAFIFDPTGTGKTGYFWRVPQITFDLARGSTSTAYIWTSKETKVAWHCQRYEDGVATEQFVSIVPMKMRIVVACPGTDTEGLFVNWCGGQYELGFGRLTLGKLVNGALDGTCKLFFGDENLIFARSRSGQPQPGGIPMCPSHVDQNGDTGEPPFVLAFSQGPTYHVPIGSSFDGLPIGIHNVYAPSGFRVSKL